MNSINQNFRFFIHVALPVLLCFAMTPSAIAAEHYSSWAMADISSQRADHQKINPMRLADSTTANKADNSAGPDEAADRQATRQKMIEHCEANRGTDCERAVAIELEAQELEMVHTSPPDLSDRAMRPRPRPRAR